MCFPLLFPSSSVCGNYTLNTFFAIGIIKVIDDYYFCYNILRIMNNANKSAVKFPLGIFGLLLFLAFLFPNTSFSTWYWQNHAQIPMVNLDSGFWGSDPISQFFQWSTNPLLYYSIKIWNVFFGSDIIRLAFPIIIGGFLATLGNDLYKIKQRSEDKHN